MRVVVNVDPQSNVVVSLEVSVNELPLLFCTVATAKTGTAGQFIVDGDGKGLMDTSQITGGGGGAMVVSGVIV